MDLLHLSEMVPEFTKLTLSKLSVVDLQNVRLTSKKCQIMVEKMAFGTTAECAKLVTQRPQRQEQRFPRGTYAVNPLTCDQYMASFCLCSDICTCPKDCHIEETVIRKGYVKDLVSGQEIQVLLLQKNNHYKIKAAHKFHVAKLYKFLVFECIFTHGEQLHNIIYIFDGQGQEQETFFPREDEIIGYGDDKVFMAKLTDQVSLEVKVVSIYDPGCSNTAMQSKITLGSQGKWTFIPSQQWQIKGNTGTFSLYVCLENGQYQFLQFGVVVLPHKLIMEELTQGYNYNVIGCGMILVKNTEHLDILSISEAGHIAIKHLDTHQRWKNPIISIDIVKNQLPDGLSSSWSIVIMYRKRMTCFVINNKGQILKRVSMSLPRKGQTCECRHKLFLGKTLVRTHDQCDVLHKFELVNLENPEKVFYHIQQLAGLYNGQLTTFDTKRKQLIFAWKRYHDPFDLVSLTWDMQ
jgi:hypothetical protein